MSNAPDLNKARRENLRWMILQCLNSAQPIGASETLIHSAVTPLIPDLTDLELRQALDYLQERHLIDIVGRGTQPFWFCKLGRHGIDVTEYTVDCEPGIARPAKYW
jgi:hypothetical protein